MELRIRELDVDIIAPNRETMNRPEQGGSKIVIIGKPGTGKCLGRGTEILMADYSIQFVEKIKVGDRLCGDDGTPRLVLSTTQGRDVLYRIEQSAGMSYIINQEHILCLRSFHDPSDIVEVKCRELVKDLSMLDHYGGYTIDTLSRDNDVSLYHSLETCVKYKRPFYHGKNGGIHLKLFSNEFPETGSSLQIELHDPDGEYFGFEIDGNGRFCLADGTVTHNTTLITSLLYEKRHIFPTAVIMSGTEDSNHHYKRIIPSTFVYNRLNEKKIEDFVVRQKAAKKFVPNPWAVLLLDDCTDDPKLFNKPLFQGLYKNGRHWKMLFVLSLQYCMDIKPVIRTNVDGVFILRETNLRNRKSLWENYAGIIPDFSLFCTIMDQLTDNYTALYIHNATTSNHLEDCLFWYKAKPVPDNFRFGSKDFWKFHYHRYDDRYSDPIV